MKQNAINPKLLIGLGLLVVVGVWFMLLRPQGTRLADARIERSDAEAQLALAQQQASTTTTVASDEPSGADLAVPAEAGLPSVLRELASIAGESGLELTTVTPDPLAALPGGSSLGVTIGATGSRAGAYAYLNRLATLPRLVIVEQVTLELGSGQDGGAPDPSAAGAGTVSDDVTLQLTARLFTTEAPPAVPTS